MNTIDLGELEGKWVAVDVSYIGRTVLVRLGVAEDGRLVCTGVVVGADDESREVTSRELHGLRLGHLVTQLAEGHENPFIRDLYAQTVEGTAGKVARPKLRSGPKGHDRTHFETVARVYQQALLRSPRSPMKATREQLGYGSVAQVRRWVNRARELGLVGGWD